MSHQQNDNYAFNIYRSLWNHIPKRHLSSSIVLTRREDELPGRLGWGESRVYIQLLEEWVEIGKQPLKFVFLFQMSEKQQYSMHV